ncbi:MAG: hypothetical protein EZS28_008333 [Streblomastix strix]|uniref:Uncharacterized protein n=1 Tax=Streblomastix strix TaxID=222440 RepID=A0A5J4WPL2_9EUKA|nr:MAG: hypothetical protein EZS28_008333 [Streblomastix strix]
MIPDVQVHHLAKYVMTVDLLGTVVGGYRGWKQNIGEVDEVVASESEIDQIYQSILKKNQKKRKKLEKKIQIQKSKEIKLDKVNEKDKVDVKEKEDEQQQEEQIKEDEKDNSSLTKVKHSKSKTKSKQKDKSKRKNESYSDQASVKSQSVVGPEKPNHKHLNINKQNLGEDESKIKDEILIEKDAHSEIIKKQKEGGEIKIFETMQQKIDQQINGYKPFDNQTNPMRTRPVRYLNVDMRTMKYFTARLMAERRQPVWMGCHMNHYFSKSSAMLDQAGFKFDCIYDVEWSEDEDDEKDDEEEDEEEDGKDNQKQQDKELIKKITYSDPKEIEEQVLSDIHERELKQFDPNAWEKKERRKKDKKNNKKNNKKKKIGQYYQDDKNICGKFGQWTKADRISYGETMMSHAMLFTGENIIEGAGFKQGSGVLNMPYQRSPSANLDVIDSNLIKQQKEYLLYFEENLRKQEIDLNRMQDKHHIGQSEDEKKEFDKKVEICRERMKQYTQQMQLLLHMSSFRLFVMTGTSYLRMAEKMIEIIDENKLIVLPEKIVDKEKESKLEEDNENKKKEDNDQEKKNENVIDKEKEQIRDKDKEKMDRWKLAFDRLIRQKTTESLKTQDTVVVIKADEQDIIEQKDTKRDNKEKETKDDQTKTTLFDEELAQQYSVIKLTNQENIIVDKWRIENSWGDTMENAGFLTMTNMWFDEHVLEIAVPIDILPPELQAEYHQKPYILPPWDPMGTLA